MGGTMKEVYLDPQFFDLWAAYEEGTYDCRPMYALMGEEGQKEKLEEAIDKSSVYWAYMDEHSGGDTEEILTEMCKALALCGVFVEIVKVSEFWEDMGS
jgi:hypothetical protein